MSANGAQLSLAFLKGTPFISGELETWTQL